MPSMNGDNASLLLYAVTDRSWLHGQTLYEQAEQALQGGATFLQLREKELDEAHFQEEAIALKALCRQYGVPFVLDDNVALAVATDADGVHVGQSDMAAGKVRALIGPDKIPGVSAQTVEEALLVSVVEEPEPELPQPAKVAVSSITAARRDAIFFMSDSLLRPLGFVVGNIHIIQLISRFTRG